MSQCPAWCAEEHPETGFAVNPREGGWHRSVDMKTDYVFDSGKNATWYMFTDLTDPDGVLATIGVNFEDGLTVADLRDLAPAMLKIADEMGRITGPTSTDQPRRTTESALAAQPAVGPCPDWCALPAGHPYTEHNPSSDEYIRSHHSAEHRVNGADIEQSEHCTSGGVVTLDPTIFLNYFGDDLANPTSSEVIEMAQELLAVAEIIKTIDRPADER